MEFDMSHDERLAIWAAVIEDAHNNPYPPELQDRMLRFAKLLMDCGEAGCTLHVN